MTDRTVSYIYTIIKRIKLLISLLQSSKFTPTQRAVLTAIKYRKMSQLNASRFTDPAAYDYAFLLSGVNMNVFNPGDRQNAEMMTTTTTCSSGESSYNILCNDGGLNGITTETWDCCSLEEIQDYTALSLSNCEDDTGNPCQCYYVAI